MIKLTERERPMTEEKFVRIMCDYQSDGIWDKNGAAAELDELPVSAGLRTRLRAWQLAFEEADMGSLPKSFSDDGREIAKAVKAELPEWTVIYFDEWACQRLRDTWKHGDDRAGFEYEISGD